MKRGEGEGGGGGGRGRRRKLRRRLSIPWREFEGLNFQLTSAFTIRCSGAYILLN